MVDFKPGGQLALTITAFPTLLCCDVFLLCFADTSLARALAGIEETPLGGTDRPTAPTRHPAAPHHTGHPAGHRPGRSNPAVGGRNPRGTPADPPYFNLNTYNACANAPTRSSRIFTKSVCPFNRLVNPSKCTILSSRTLQNASGDLHSQNSIDASFSDLNRNRGTPEPAPAPRPPRAQCPI